MAKGKASLDNIRSIQKTATATVRSNANSSLPVEPDRNITTRRSIQYPTFWTDAFKQHLKGRDGLNTFQAYILAAVSQKLESDGIDLMTGKPKERL